MTKYMSKPVEIEAIQWTGDNKNEVEAFLDKTVITSNTAPVSIVCMTRNGPVSAFPSDYIIKTNDEFYPCPEDVFERKYERLAPVGSQG